MAINPTCRAMVYVAYEYTSRLCGNPAKHDNLTRCGIHSADAEAKRRAKVQAKIDADKARDAERRKAKLDRAAEVAFKALTGYAYNPNAIHPIYDAPAMDKAKAIVAALDKEYLI